MLKPKDQGFNLQTTEIDDDPRTDPHDLGISPHETRGI